MSENRKAVVKKEDFFTIPNILTYFRIILIPAFVVLYTIGFQRAGQDIPDGRSLEWWGVGAVVAASLTDFIDGKIARKFNMITDLGKFMDPLADKLMQAAIAGEVCYIYYELTKTYYMFILLGIFVVKELTQSMLIFYTYYKGDYIAGAKWYGKVSTFGFDVLMITVLALPLFVNGIKNYEIYIIIAAIVIACLLVFAWVMYTIDCLSTIKDRKRNDRAAAQKLSDSKEADKDTSTKEKRQ